MKPGIFFLILLVSTYQSVESKERRRRFLPLGSLLGSPSDNWLTGQSTGGFGDGIDPRIILALLNGLNPGVSIGFSKQPQFQGANNNLGRPQNLNTQVETTSTGDFAAVALKETNKYRAMHGAKPLILDPKLSAGAQAWAEKLAGSNSMQHSQSSDYGENLWMMGGQILDATECAKRAVKSWYDEVKMYNYNNPTFAGNTGHFTALVWKGSAKMGIGIAFNQARRSTYVVARYVPAGNMMGSFKENVGPRQ